MDNSVPLLNSTKILGEIDTNKEAARSAKPQRKIGSPKKNKSIDEPIIERESIGNSKLPEIQ